MSAKPQQYLLSKLRAEYIYRAFLHPKTADISRAVEEGMLPKRELLHDVTYIGYSLYVTEALWDASKHRFVYTNEKDGKYSVIETHHPEDILHAEIFVPVGVQC